MGVVVGVLVAVVLVAVVVGVEVVVGVVVLVGVLVGHASHMCGHSSCTAGPNSPSQAGGLNSNQHTLGSTTPLQSPSSDG
jgi:hypothetical protein